MFTGTTMSQIVGGEIEQRHFVGHTSLETLCRSIEKHIHVAVHTQVFC